MHLKSTVPIFNELSLPDDIFSCFNPLKVVSATFLLVCFSSLKESICETWKNAFYFASKALVIVEKIKF